MLSLSRQFRPHRCISRPDRLRGGFTLIEIVIALAVLGTMAAGAYLGFNSINTYAVSSRLYSEAQATAQHHIDIVLSKSPFDVMVVPKKIPLELMTAAELAALNPALATSPPPSSNAYYPYYRDSNGRLAKQAFIYKDPATDQILVTGTLASTATELGDAMTMEGTTNQLNTRRVTAEVTYKFRNTNYVVAMDTLRTADR
jgi:prepilin-type N-terminal cleavage/methylation domain-containing protein